MYKKVIIIGAGQLGSRHLQGLTRSTCNLEIDIVDKSNKMLNMSKQRFNDMNATNCHVNYYNKIPKMEHYDLAIIATCSIPRATVTKELILNNDISYIVFEKILFPVVEEYDEIGQLLNKNNISAFVNCVYRIYPHWKELKPFFTGPIHVSVCGGEWGMVTNSIHIVDLVSWMTGEITFTWDISNLDHGVFDSKRSGYAEYYGTLFVKGNNGSTIEMYSKHFGPPFTGIILVGKNAIASISQRDGIVDLHTKDNQFSCMHNSFHMPYQSELTHIFADDLLNTGKCELPDYKLASLLHIDMIKAFNNHLKRFNSHLKFT